MPHMSRHRIHLFDLVTYKAQSKLSQIKDENGNFKYRDILTGYGKRQSGEDGFNGGDTKEAVREYQKDNNLSVTGELDRQTLQWLGVIDEKANPAQESRPIALPPPASWSPNNSKPSDVDPQQRTNETTAVFDPNSQTLRLPNGEVYKAGSGFGNVPEDKKKGPIPHGLWNVGSLVKNHVFREERTFREECTRDVCSLTPCEGTETYGRNRFYLHWRAMKERNGKVMSHGCLAIGNRQMANLILKAREHGVFNKILVLPLNPSMALKPRAPKAIAQYTPY
ncbi:MAG: peptidoglycan-binding protein [Alphaproteobacteria bacterium]|nr:peptidoglycan-binding protein [Alphaproteobacteria bacterium]